MKKMSHFSFSFFLLFFGFFSNKPDDTEEKKIENKPRVSIITSVYDGDAFIEGFLQDITEQSIFSICELILINAHSPGHEEEVIQKYQKIYPNIIYEKLSYDPGIYGVWNLAIKKASSDYIGNANLDDRSDSLWLERFAKALDENPDIDLVYAARYFTHFPNETLKNHHSFFLLDPPQFSKKNMYYCLPGQRPMWRKSLHDRFGFFSEIFFSAGDQEMWLRAVSLGAKFKKLPGINDVVYWNPKGLSSDADAKKKHRRDLELELIKYRYGYVYDYAPPNLHLQSP